MSNFDEYWEKNKEKYLEIIKQDALKDFNRIEQEDLFSVNVHIDTDDDFSLDCGYSLTTSGATKKIAIQKMIDSLSSAKLTRVNGNHAQDWYYIRDAAIKSLKKGETSSSFGGNQTIETSVFENTLVIHRDIELNSIKKKNKP